MNVIRRCTCLFPYEKNETIFYFPLTAIFMHDKKLLIYANWINFAIDSVSSTFLKSLSFGRNSSRELKNFLGV